ncbi:MAG: hypothetical protein KKG00_05015, partial [Bacteroidetes bacterium]|nr:hypothetical protein [Bacteroidota bacterium]
MTKSTLNTLFLLIALLAGCRSSTQNQESVGQETSVVVQAEEFTGSSTNDIKRKGETVELDPDQWLSYDLNVPTLGRYRVEVQGSGSDSAAVWVEDYID